MDIQWYPGHMAKAKKAMQEDLKLVDMVAEVTDARAPLSSRNPDIDTLSKNKLRIIIMNKADLADEKINKAWQKYFSDKGYGVVFCDARASGSRNVITDCILKSAQPKFEKDKAKGIIARPVRVMVTGIPNVGKSTIINSLAKKSCAKTGNKPGVTRGNQWIRPDRKIELLDTPGLLWPKFDDMRVGMRLAWLGSVSDDIVDITGLAAGLIKELETVKPGALNKRYDTAGSGDVYETLDKIALKRSLIKKGGGADTDRAARMLLEEFRMGKIGRITLETPLEDRK